MHDGHSPMARDRFSRRRNAVGFENSRAQPRRGRRQEGRRPASTDRLLGVWLQVALRRVARLTPPGRAFGRRALDPQR
jgi:hypothetical protein